MIVSIASCEGAPQVKVDGENVPSVEARVLTIRVNIPEERAFTTSFIVAGTKVRLGSEADRWRLFDLETGSVTFVDDVERTYRTESLGELVRRRRAALRRPLPDGLPRATITKTGASRSFNEIPAEHYLIQLGGYKREVWLSRQPLIDPRFFAMLIASEPIDPESAPAMVNVDVELSRLQGFPVFDRSEMPFGEGSLVIERLLMSVETRRVPRSWIEIPGDYRDESVKGSPGGQQSAS